MILLLPGLRVFLTICGFYTQQEEDFFVVHKHIVVKKTVKYLPKLFYFLIVKMIIYIIIFIIAVYAFLKERAMLGCPMFHGECDGYSAKPLDHTKSDPNDSMSTTLKKIEKASSWTRNTVYWRRAYIISAIAIIIFIWITTYKFPTERELIMGIFILGTTLCISFNFYQFHLNGIAEERINDLIYHIHDLKK